MNKLQQYSWVKFDYDSIPKAHHKDYPFRPDVSYIYFGEIPNMPGHCIVLEPPIRNTFHPTVGQFHVGYHTENFREATDDEV